MPGLDALLEGRAIRVEEGALFTILGVTGDRNECDLCGKSGLKKTVALKPVGGGATVYYGSDCAAKALGWGEGEGVRVMKIAKTAQAEADKSAAADIERARREALPDTDATTWLKTKADPDLAAPILKSFIYADSQDAELRRRFADRKARTGRFPWEPR